MTKRLMFSGEQYFFSEVSFHSKASLQSWLVDSNRFASNIKSASGACDPENIKWKSNPTKACPNCHHIVDNSDVKQAWPGLPRGVIFDPLDQEIIWHLLAKSGA
ncbi:putative NAC domain-containing protein SOG1 [Helianthus annuus]|nr:putative NAC domain-containing protein SOG1 [Helianthus annuus]